MFEKFADINPFLYLCTCVYKGKSGRIGLKSIHGYYIDIGKAMKDRIRQLMLDKGMSQKTFASELCIAEATLSGIFNGRTRPTNLTVNAIHERFPDVNISWLMFGEGEMYVSAPGEKHGGENSAETSKPLSQEGDLFSMTNSSVGMQNFAPQKHDANMPMSNGTQILSAGIDAANPQAMPPKIQYIEKYIDRPQRKITEIRIFFDDGTYETFTP